MITKDLATKIWTAHNEIEKSKKLLEDMRKSYDDYTENYELTDTWGRGRRLQLGVPSGSNGHRLFDVDYKLARKIIKKHIRKQIVKLELLTEETKALLDEGLTASNYT